MANKVYLSENLAYLRKKQGLRQAQLAELAGVQPTTISNYEKGISSPDLETLGRIKDALQVSVDDLVYMTPVQFQMAHGDNCKENKDTMQEKKYYAVFELMQKLEETKEVFDNYKKEFATFIAYHHDNADTFYRNYKNTTAKIGEKEHYEAVELFDEKK